MRNVRRGRHEKEMEIEEGKNRKGRRIIERTQPPTPDETKRREKKKVNEKIRK